MIEKLKLKVAGALVNDAPMGAYVARPDDAKPVPAVIVLEEIFGVNAHIRDVTDRIAALGYVAIAPDYHHRAAPGIELDYDAEGMKKGKELIPKLTRAGFLADVDATLGWLKAQPFVRQGKVGCIGFCIGGHMAYLLAEHRAIAATASFYGGGITTFSPGGGSPTVTDTSLIHGRILCLFGAKDKNIPPEQVDQIRSMLAQHKIKGEVVVYPDAGHGFFCDRRGSYDPAAAKDAFARVTKLFHEALA